MRYALYLLYALIWGSGCTSTSPEREQPTEVQKPSKPALSVVTESRTDLLFRYAVKEGFSTASTIAEIPVESRGYVQVIDLALSPAQRGSTQYAQIFDLRTPMRDGTFGGQVIPRSALEATLAKKAEKPPKRNDGSEAPAAEVNLSTRQLWIGSSHSTDQ